MHTQRSPSICRLVSNGQAHLLSELQESMALALARVPPGRDLDVADVAVEVGRPLVEGGHELVQRLEGELRRAAQRQADDVPLLPVERGSAREDDVSENETILSVKLPHVGSCKIEWT